MRLLRSLAALYALATTFPATALEGQPGIHDPSTVFQDRGRYYSLGTGAGLPVLARGNNTWAPDVIRVGKRIYVYYSAPGVFLDPSDGRMWLTYGSYFGYIRLVELDPRTGLRRYPARKPLDIAINSEASIIIRHDDWYYLLVTHGSCCQGANSTYNIRMGRSRRSLPDGPFGNRKQHPDTLGVPSGIGRTTLEHQGAAMSTPVTRRTALLLPLLGLRAAWSAATAYPAHPLDTSGYNVNLYHFAWALSKPTSNVLFWVTTMLEVPADVQNARLAIGSNAASVWWLDEERLVSIYNDRQTVIDDGVSRRLQLRKGRHVRRAAIVNGGGATDFCARFLGDDGRPLTSLVSLLAQDS